MVLMAMMMKREKLFQLVKNIDLRCLFHFVVLKYPKLNITITQVILSMVVLQIKLFKLHLFTQ